MVSLLLSALMSASPGPAPVVVELFTSEGCSSCPPADDALRVLAESQPEGVQVIALGMHVDYWNHLGWKDPFSLPDFTARQVAYAEAGVGSTYTPQMVVNGRTQFVGSLQKARAAIEKLPPLEPLAVTASRRGDGVSVSLPKVKGGASFVGLVERGLSSKPTRGENRGETLAHGPVVRSLRRVAPGEAVLLTIDPSWRAENLSVFAFAQREGPGEIFAAGMTPLPAR